MSDTQHLSAAHTPSAAQDASAVEGMRPVELSLVLPAYQAAPFIGPNVRRALDVFAGHGLAGEVIVADDGSTDGTADAVPVAPNVRVLRLEHRGKGGALRAGMLAATGTVRAFTDADLPYGLEPVIAAAAVMRERHAHAVIGDRSLPGSVYRSGRTRRAFSGLASLAFRVLSPGEAYDTQCGLKCFRGDVAAELFRLARVDGFAIDIEILFVLRSYGLRVERIPVRLEAAAKTSVHVLRDSARAARDVVAIRLDRARGRYRSDVLERAGAEAGADQPA
jgi:dolichyl-phosphate beta-glucosyltransferase